MSALITINFGGGTAANNNVELLLSDCAVATSMDGGVTVAMASALTNITVVSGQVSIATATGALFNGAVAIAINWASNDTPRVTLSNLTNTSNPATVSWPTSSGPQTQALTPGDPMTLNGIINAS